MDRSESPTPMDVAAPPQTANGSALIPSQPAAFLDALHAVPKLFESCINPFYCTIKTMRMVSKTASKVALRAVSSYTLTLGTAESAISDDLEGVGQLLCCTQFRRLRVYLFNPDQPCLSALISPGMKVIGLRNSSTLIQHKRICSLMLCCKVAFYES